VCCLLLFTGAAGLIFEVVVENSHVGQFGELDRAPEALGSSPNLP